MLTAYKVVKILGNTYKHTHLFKIRRILIRLDMYLKLEAEYII